MIYRVIELGPVTLIECKLGQGVLTNQVPLSGPSVGNPSTQVI